MNEYIKKALLDYKELELFLKLYEGSFNGLCYELCGFNKNENYFDINFKSITTTIYYEDNKYKLCEYIDIWDDEKCEPVASCLNVNSIKEV